MSKLAKDEYARQKRELEAAREGSLWSVLYAIVDRMNDFGKGPTLKDASPYLRDDKSRIEQILTVTETDSMIEGLPPFDEATRERLRRRLRIAASRRPKPAQ